MSPKSSSSREQTALSTGSSSSSRSSHDLSTRLYTTGLRIERAITSGTSSFEKCVSRSTSQNEKWLSSSSLIQPMCRTALPAAPGMPWPRGTSSAAILSSSSAG